MEIELLEDVKGLGPKGDRVDMKTLAQKERARELILDGKAKKVE
jgi:hypothetical protein